MRIAHLQACVLEWPPRLHGDPQGSAPLQARHPRVVGHRMPLVQFGVRVDDLRVLYQPVAEVVDDGRDGEDAAEAFIKSRFCHDSVLLCVSWPWHQGRSRDGPVAPVQSLAGTRVRGPGPPPGTAAPRRARPPATQALSTRPAGLAVRGWLVR